VTQHIGMAMSGGGHRASGWALGTMFYLVHAGKHAELAVISSVSGGSITNGVRLLHFAAAPRSKKPARSRQTRHDGSHR